MKNKIEICNGDIMRIIIVLGIVLIGIFIPYIISVIIRTANYKILNDVEENVLWDFL